MIIIHSRLHHLLLLLNLSHLLPDSYEFTKTSLIVFPFSKQLLQFLDNDRRSLYLRVIQILESLLVVALQVDGLRDFKALNVPLHTPQHSLDHLNSFISHMIRLTFHQVNNV